MAVLWLYLAMHYFPADRTTPTICHLPDQVGTADNANELSLVKHGYALDALMHEEMAHLIQVSIRCHADHATAHDLTNLLPLFADDIVLGDDSNYRLLIIHDG